MMAKTGGKKKTPPIDSGKVKQIMMDDFSVIKIKCFQMKWQGKMTSTKFLIETTCMPNTKLLAWS